MQYILIADDNPDITDVLSEYAKKEGYEALLAADGEEALRLFGQYAPAVVPSVHMVSISFLVIVIL